MPLVSHPVPGLEFPLHHAQHGRWVRHSYILDVNGNLKCEWCEEPKSRHDTSPYEPLCHKAPELTVERTKKAIEEQAELQRKYAANFRAAQPFWTKPL